IPGPGTGRSGTTGVPPGATCFLPGERARGSSSCPPRLPRGASSGAVLLPLSIPACPAGRRGPPPHERRGGGIGTEGEPSPARGGGRERQGGGVPVGPQPQQDRGEPGEVPGGPPEGAPERLFVPARSLPRVGQGGVDRVEVSRGEGGVGQARL